MGRIPKVEKERALLENRLQKETDPHMDEEDADLGGMPDCYSWSDSTRGQDRMAPDPRHGGHSSRLDARPDHCPAPKKDWKQNDIPVAPRTTLSHPQQPHRSYSCEGREMPGLIPEWKAGIDFKSTLSTNSNYNGNGVLNHHPSAQAPAFTSSDSALHQGFLGAEHPHAKTGGAQGNATDSAGKLYHTHGAARAFHPPVTVKIEPSCPNFEHEPERDANGWDNFYGNNSGTHFPDVGVRYSKLSANESQLPIQGAQPSSSSWNNSYLGDDYSKQCGNKNAPPHVPFFSSAEKPAAHKEINRNSLDARPTVPHRSSYSPDIIKVLLDQVGGEKIKGIKHQIMTTVANTFGPEEYEATKQLLSSYTEPPDPDAGERSYSLHVPYGETPDSLYASANRTSGFPATSQHEASRGHEGALSPQGGEDLSRGARWLDQANGSDLTSSDAARDQMHFSSCSKHDSGLLSKSEAMETDDGLELCVPGELVDQMFSDQYDTVIDLRSSDKASGSNSQNSESDKESTSPDARGLDELSMSESSQTLLTSFEKHMSQLVAKYDCMKHFVQNKGSLPTHPLTPEGKELVYNLLITAIPSINKSIIGFCQDVPGFASLAKGDKEILIKRGYYDIWIMTNSRLFYDSESYLQLSDGTFYTRAWMERILNPVIVDKIVSFTKKFNKLELSKLELAILCAIQLTASGHESLEFEKAESIQQVNSYFVDLLVEEVSKRRPANCSRILLDLFRLLPDLRELNLLQREIIASLSTETCPDKVDYKTEDIVSDIADKDDLALFDDY